MNLKEIGKVFTSKSVGTGPSSYEKRIYRAAVSQRLRNTGIDLIKPFDQFRIYESTEFIINIGLLLHKREKLRVYSVHYVHRGTAKLRKG